MAGAKKGTPRFRRNYELAPGVMRFSAARMFHKRGIALNKKTATPKKVVEKPATFTIKKIGGPKNGGERKVALNKPPRLMNEDRAYDKPVIAARKSKVVPLRKSITPGTVLIVLAGRHKGKRVVFLKQLEKSGLLLITGPHQWNNTPVRRIAQAFVIATSTKIDVSGVKVPDHINDEYFRRKHTKKSAKGETANIFTSGKEEYKVTDQRKADQKQIDKALLAAIKKNKEGKALRGYLSTRFHLSKSALPHKILF